MDRTVLDDSSRLLLKRKDQNIDDDYNDEDDDDDDDDEDVEDSVAYSKYVQDRLNGQEKTLSTVTEKENREIDRHYEGKKSPSTVPVDTVVAGRSGRVLTALLTVIYICFFIFTFTLFSFFIIKKLIKFC